MLLLINILDFWDFSESSIDIRYYLASDIEWCMAEVGFAMNRYMIAKSTFDDNELPSKSVNTLLLVINHHIISCYKIYNTRTI